MKTRGGSRHKIAQNLALSELGFAFVHVHASMGMVGVSGREYGL